MPSSRRETRPLCSAVDLHSGSSGVESVDENHMTVRFDLSVECSEPSQPIQSNKDVAFRPMIAA